MPNHRFRCVPKDPFAAAIREEEREYRHVTILHTSSYFPPSRSTLEGTRELCACTPRFTATLPIINTPPRCEERPILELRRTNHPPAPNTAPIGMIS